MSVFVRPDWLWGLTAVAVMAVAAWRADRAKDVRRGVGMPVGGRFQWLLEAAAVALLVLAMADPRGPADGPGDGRATQVAFAVDVSRSMAVADCGGRRRIDVAADLLGRVARRTGGRPQSLTLFAGRATLTGGLSRDGSRIEAAAADVPAAAASASLPQGSDLSGGVREAAESLALGLPGGRFVVVLSDGESQTELEPVEAANVLGVCLGRSGPVPAGGWGEEATGVLRYEGDTVRSTADAAAMRTLCGELWTVDGGVADRVADAVVDRIRAADEGTARASSTDRWFRPLLIGAAVLLLATAVFRTGRGGFGVLTVMFLSGASGPSMEGHRHADRNDWVAASASFAEHVSRRPDDAEAHYNHGTALTRSVLNGQADDANRTLRQAIDSLRRAVALRPDWDAPRVNLQLTYRLLRQQSEGGGDPGESEAPPSVDPPPSGTPPNGSPPPDPFAAEPPPMSNADVDSILDDARSRDPGPAGRGDQRPSGGDTELRPW